MKRRLVGWLGRNRGGYRHNLDRIRCGRRDTGCDSRRRAGRRHRQLKLPDAIQVDETRIKVVASFVGIGKQVYDCNATGTFTFREPVAGLLSRGVQAAIHGKGPFWASFDGSHVDGSGAAVRPASRRTPIRRRTFRG